MRPADTGLTALPTRDTPPPHSPSQSALVNERGCTVEEGPGQREATLAFATPTHADHALHSLRMFIRGQRPEARSGQKDRARIISVNVKGKQPKQLSLDSKNFTVTPVKPAFFEELLKQLKNQRPALVC